MNRCREGGTLSCTFELQTTGSHRIPQTTQTTQSTRTTRSTRTAIRAPSCTFELPGSSVTEHSDRRRSAKLYFSSQFGDDRNEHFHQQCPCNLFQSEEFAMIWKILQVFLAYQFAGTVSTPPLRKIYPSLFGRFSFARFLDFFLEKNLLVHILRPLGWPLSRSWTPWKSSTQEPVLMVTSFHLSWKLIQVGWR